MYDLGFILKGKKYHELYEKIMKMVKQVVDLIKNYYIRAKCTEFVNYAVVM